MKCFNTVIFSKLIFYFKVLIYCSRENVACCGCLALPGGAMGCLLFVIVVFPDHTHLLFLGSEYPLYLLYTNHKTGDLET